jgi:phage-related protein
MNMLFEENSPHAASISLYNDIQHLVCLPMNDALRPNAMLSWEGNSKEVLRGFPVSARSNLSFDLFQLEQHRMPEAFRPMPSIGPKVYELKDGDEKTWYRLIYLSEINNVIYVLHCFEKQGSRTPRKDLKTAKKRLSGVHARLRRGEA